MTIGSLVVSLEADIAQFTSSMDKAAAISQQRMEQIDKSLGLVKTSLMSLGAGALAGISLDAITNQIESVIKTASGLQELAERTGAAADQLGAIGLVAKLSNTDMDSLATGMQKLSKSMIDAEDGGKKSEAAFNSIGISVADLKNKKPDEVFQLIAQKMANYADGAGKTAVAQQLLGKAGANLLPVMKDLADAGDLQVKMTDQQIAMANEYEKNLVRLSIASNMVWQTIAMEALPVLNDFVKVLVTSATGTGTLKEAVDSLARDGTLMEWAESAAMAAAYVVEALTGVVRAAYAVVGSIQAVRADTTFLLTAYEKSGTMGTGLLFKENRDAIKQALDERNKVVEDANKRYIDLWNYNGTALSDALRKKFHPDAMTAQENFRASEISSQNAAKRRPQVPFQPNSAVAPKDDPARAYMEGQIKAQDAIVAADKKQFSAREQVLKEFYQEQYMSADDYYSTEIAMIQDELKAELDAYDKEKNAAKDYLAHLEGIKNTEKQQQEAKNKLAEIAAKAAAAQTDASQKLTQVVMAQAKVYRDFDLATTAAVYQWGLQNDAAKFSIDMMGQNTVEVQKLTAARQIDLQVQQQIHDLQLKGFDIDSPEVARLRADAEVQKAAAVSLVEQAYRKQTDAVFGASEAFRKYSEDSHNLGSQMESTLTNSLKGIEDAFVSLATTGKLNFKSLADSVVADITRMTVKENITGPLSDWMKGGMTSGTGLGGWLSGMLGGGSSDASQAAQEAFRTTELVAQKTEEVAASVTATTALTALAEAAASAATSLSASAMTGDGSGSGLMGLFGSYSASGMSSGLDSMGFSGFMANGGDLSPGQWAVVGEKGPELFKPSTGGSIIPNDQIGLGGGETHNHYYNITVPMPAGGSRQTGMQFGAEVARQLAVHQTRAGRS